MISSGRPSRSKCVEDNSSSAMEFFLVGVKMKGLKGVGVSHKVVLESGLL
jgi:hypothetical protein